MRNFNIKRSAYDLCRIMLGTCLSGMAVAFFSNPAKLTAGGVSGIATIIYNTLGFDLGIVMLCFNIPLYCIGAIFFGKQYGVKVLFGSTMLSVWTSVLGNMTGYRGFLDYTDSANIILSAIAYGVLMGAGIGIVMRAGSSTGGTDIIAKLISKYTPFTVGTISFALNAVVIFTASFFFGLQRAIFSFIGIFISGRVVDYVVVELGTSLAKTVYVFSKNHIPDISRYVINEIHHGGTVFSGTGIYTSSRRDMLMVIVPNNQLLGLERFIHEVDPTAFVFVNETFQVLGNGFSPLKRVKDQNT